MMQTLEAYMDHSQHEKELSSVVARKALSTSWRLRADPGSVPIHEPPSSWLFDYTRLLDLWHVYSNQPDLLALLLHWCKEVESVLGIVLLLQHLETILAPLLVAVPIPRRFIPEGIIYVCVQLITAATFVNNVTKLVTKLGCPFIEFVPGRRVGD